ncbi:MAG: AAA family ATPase, partial [Pyrinomonadaceae bacterium]
MHDLIPRKAKATEEEAQRSEYVRPMKANEYLKKFAGAPPPAMIFDEFWREGELALMFGPTGAGKSLLATQIAEALARGRPIGSLKMPAKRQRVLYIDLTLSDRQFCTRYGGYRFSENLLRWRPETTDKFGEWLRKTIIAERTRYIIIDDLSALRQAFDGTRETLKLMRELRRIKDELDVSILVLSDCREPRNGVVISERDMLRSRVLCDAADSVFAMAAHPSCPYSRDVVQTRTAYRPAWTASNAPTCWIEKNEDGLIGLVFDERFTPPMDVERVRLICEVRRRWDAGQTYREMAPELGISPATASRLRKKWRPGLDDTIPGTVPGPPEPTRTETQPADFDDDEPTEWEEAELEEPEWLHDDPPAAAEDDVSWPAAEDDEYAPPAHAAGSDLPDTRRGLLLALGFRQTYDKNDREIFVEREDDPGRPLVWYRFQRKNQRSDEEILKRVEYSFPGTSQTSVDGP